MRERHPRAPLASKIRGLGLNGYALHMQSGRLTGTRVGPADDRPHAAGSGSASSFGGRVGRGPWTHATRGGGAAKVSRKAEVRAPGSGLRSAGITATRVVTTLRVTRHHPSGSWRRSAGCRPRAAGTWAHSRRRR
jgi:hypothetical protein